MDGMTSKRNYLYTRGTGEYTVTYRHELPPSNTICQLSMGKQIDWQNVTTANMGFTYGQYRAPDGSTQEIPNISQGFAAPVLLAQNQMTRIDWFATVSGCELHWLLNLFFWGSVSSEGVS